MSPLTFAKESGLYPWYVLCASSKWTLIDRVFKGVGKAEPVEIERMRSKGER